MSILSTIRNCRRRQFFAVVGIMYMCLYVPVAHGALETTQHLSSQTTDAAGTAQLAGDDVQGLSYYSTAGEGWTTPTTSNFSGWAANGKKYINGVEQTEGDVSVIGNVRPSEDIQGQNWNWYSGLNESTHTSLDNGILHIVDDSTSSGGYSLYQRDTPTLTPSTDFVMKIRARINAGAGGGREMYMHMVAEDGERQMLASFNLTSARFANNGANTNFASYPVDTTQYQVYEMIKSGSTVILKINGTQVLSTDINNFDATSSHEVYFGTGGTPETSTIDVDYVQYQIGSTSITSQPHAPWATEATSAIRGPTQTFPTKSYLVANELGVNIVSATNSHEMWMQFVYGTNTSLGVSTSPIHRPMMQNGKLFLGKNNGGGLLMIDFTDGYTYQYTTSGKKKSNQGIPARNTQNTVFTTVGPGINSSNNVSWVSPAIITTTPYVAIGTDNGVSVIDLNSNALREYVLGGSLNSTAGMLTSDGELYTSQTIGGASLQAFYDIPSDTPGLLDWTSIRDALYSTSTFPAILDIANDIKITTNTSAAHASSNTIYYASPSGLSIIQEKQGDEGNGTGTHYGSVSSSDIRIGQKILAGSTDNVISTIPLSSSSLLALSFDGTNLSRGALSYINTSTNTLLQSLTENSVPGPTNLHFSDIAPTPLSDYFLLGTAGGIDIIKAGFETSLTLSLTQVQAENVRYSFSLTPSTPLVNGSTIEISFPEMYTSTFGLLSSSDIAVTGIAITSSTKVFDTQKNTLKITLTTSSTVDTPISIVIGDGAVGGLQDLTNPDNPGGYGIGIDIYNATHTLTNQGLVYARVGGDVSITAWVTEALIFTLDHAQITLEAAPSINNGSDKSQYNELTVASNAINGYSIYGRIDDGNGLASLSNGNYHIESGIGTNTLGLEIKNAAYSSAEVVQEDTYLQNVSTILHSNGINIGKASPTNGQQHTIYYNLNVDYTIPAGVYTGTITYTVLGSF